MAIKITKYPDQEILKQSYGYVDDKLVWKLWNNRPNRVGSPVGTMSHNKGYWKTTLSIDGISKSYYLHRLVWIWHNGDIPENMEIDHIDLNKSNNKIENLRLVSHLENTRKYKKFKNNTSGAIGVYWYKNYKKWVALIEDRQKTINLGYFINKEDAIKARKDAEIKYGYYENHGIDISV